MCTAMNTRFLRIVLFGLGLSFLTSCSSEKGAERKDVTGASPAPATTAAPGTASTAPGTPAPTATEEVGKKLVANGEYQPGNASTAGTSADSPLLPTERVLEGVGSSQIVDPTLTLADLGDNSVTSAEIVESEPGDLVATGNGVGRGLAIATSRVGDKLRLSSQQRAIRTDDLIDNTITSADIRDNTVTSADIVDGTIFFDGAGNPVVASDVIIDNSITNDGIGGDTTLAAMEDIPDEAENPSMTAEEYHPIVENNFLSPAASPLSTFSIDVDAASYSNTRRYITGGSLPPVDAVRIEELVNYFSYDYPEPTGDDPFSIVTETAVCPWNERHRLVQVGLQGRHVATDKVPASNLVFLIDVSGSMQDPNKLPLLKEAFGLLVDQLREQDKVSIVVYAGNAGLVLPPTSGSRKDKIRQAIMGLEAGGSTAGGEGIELAYATARQNFKENGNNRVILATDGDFNVGVSSEQELVALIEKERNDGIFLSVLGFGMGNYKDARMEQLADNGNGNYAYIDNDREARKVMVREFGGTLYTIAKDVKLQIEFNPKAVAAYRLIGYENRVLAARDFDDDRKDAGDMGAGHSVTALYEVVPIGAEDGVEIEIPLDSTRYRLDVMRPAAYGDRDLMEVRLRYKQPRDTVSNLLGRVVRDEEQRLEQATGNFRFAAAVAEFGLVLRNSRYKGNASFDDVLHLAKNALGSDPEGDRAEFVSLTEIARTIAGRVALGSVR